MSSSFVDQALLSLINLAVGMVFIRFATKGEYAAYAQVMALVYLTTSIQNALINSPALTLLPRKEQEEREAFAGCLFNLQAAFSLAFAVVAGSAVWWGPEFFSLHDASGRIALALALAIWVGWMRDFVRNQLFVGLHTDSCLRLDLLYAMLTAAGFALLITGGEITADRVLLMLSFVGVVTGLPWLVGTGIRFHRDWKRTRAALGEAWTLAKWSLPGGLVSWAFANGYVLITTETAGAYATAEIVAARLFVAPLGVAYMAWANVFRPRASHWLAAGDVGKVRQVSYGAVLGIVVGVIIYLAALSLVYPLLEQHLLGEKYRGLATVIAWWGGFFAAGGVAGIGTGVLLALGRTREIFVAAAIGCLVSIPSMFVLGNSLGKTGILLGLTTGEVIAAIGLLLSVQRGFRSLEKSRAES